MLDFNRLPYSCAHSKTSSTGVKEEEEEEVLLLFLLPSTIAFKTSSHFAPSSSKTNDTNFALRLFDEKIFLGKRDAPTSSSSTPESPSGNTSGLYQCLTLHLPSCSWFNDTCQAFSPSNLSINRTNFVFFLFLALSLNFTQCSPFPGAQTSHILLFPSVSRGHVEESSRSIIIADDSEEVKDSVGMDGARNSRNICATNASASMTSVWLPLTVLSSLGCAGRKRKPSRLKIFLTSSPTKSSSSSSAESSSFSSSSPSFSEDEEDIYLFVVIVLVVEKFEGAAHGKNVVMNKKRRISEGAKNLSLSLSLSNTTTRATGLRVLLYIFY